MSELLICLLIAVLIVCLVVLWAKRDIQRTDAANEARAEAIKNAVINPTEYHLHPNPDGTYRLVRIQYDWQNNSRSSELVSSITEADAKIYIANIHRPSIPLEVPA